MNRFVLVVLALGCLFGPARLPGQNLITNGNFDAGNSGFTSGYTFVASGVSRIPGTFGLRASSADFNPSYAAFTDHTGNGGLMMLLDGATAAGTTVWQETVPVNAGLDYTFSAWTTAFNSTNPPRLRFFVNAVPVGPDLDVTSVSGNWQNFTAVWNAGSSTSATISIVDTMVQDGGNNFALDDLSFVTTSGTVQFAAATANTTESAGSIALTVQRAGGSAGAITVDYTTADGTALAGTDYTATTGTLTWADGDAADKTITVPITDRQIRDGSTKTFGVGLTNVTGGAAPGTILAASVNILDNDVAPQPAITLASPPTSLTVVAGADLPLAATVSDPGGVLASVQFVLDGAPVGPALTTAPFVFDTTVPAAPGAHVVAVSVTDTLGRTSTGGPATLTVIAPTATAPPTTNVLSAVAGRTLAAGTSVTICAAAAADPGTTLDQLSFYADGVLLQTFSATPTPTPPAASSEQGPVRRDAPAIAPITFAKGASFAQPPGADKLVNLVTVALDKLGHSTVSQVSTFHSKVADHPAPVVAVTGATNTSHFPLGSTTAIQVNARAGTATGLALPQAGPGRADAGSDAQLAQLEYFINGVSLGKSTAPPFSFDFTPPKAGKYVFVSVATDASGLAAVSTPVTVIADPVPPTVNLAAGGTGPAVEGGAKGIVVVTRTGDMSAALAVTYKVKGTAVAGVDYKKLPGTVTIPAGAAKAKIKVKPIDGSPNAGTRKVKVVLLPSIDDSYVMGTATATIKLIGK